MLTSANQYLRPEYLPPVSSPLDANKSPLALLAKTCSSIGVDTPSVKSLTSGGSSSSTTSSSSNSSSSNSSTNERRTTPKSKLGDSQSSINHSNNNGDHSHHHHHQSSMKLNFKPYELGSKGSNKSHHENESKVNHHKIRSPNNTNHHHHHHSPDPSKQQASTNHVQSSAPLSYTSLGLPDMHKDSLAAFYKAYGFLGPNCCPTTGPGSPYASLMPPPITLDKTGAYPSIYPPTPSATAAAAALAAYNYARIGGNKPTPSSSASPPNPLCRDPYCGGSCGQFGPSIHGNPQSTAQAMMAASHAHLLREAAAAAAAAASISASIPTSNASNSHAHQHHSTSSSSSSPNVVQQQQQQCTPATCPNGCNQCEHQRYLAAITAAAYGQSFPGLVPGSMGPYPVLSASYASSLAAAAALHHRTTSSTNGNVCNWIVGDTHCGKRCQTSEELLQHLKTHTSNTDSNNSGGSQSSPTTRITNSPSQQQQQQQSRHPQTPSPHSSSTNVNHRLSSSSSSTSTNTSTVGTNSVSPGSLSLHSNSRYHPYSKPIGNGPIGTYSGPPPPVSYGLSGSAAAAAAAAAAATGMSPFTSASGLYYPYMTPNLFAGRIGPPVPP